MIFVPFLILFLAHQLDNQKNFERKFEKTTNFFDYLIKKYLSYGSFNLKEFLYKTLFNQFLYEFQIMKNLMDFCIKTNN